MRCPNCQSTDEPKAIGFTWWGGMIGAKLLNHVECVQCRTRFNGKTGGNNQGAIAIYMIVVGVLAFGLMYMLLKSMR